MFPPSSFIRHTKFWRAIMFHMMGHLGCQGDAAVDVATQTDGDELIGVMIVADGSESQVLDMQCAEGLEILRVRPLHIVLQRVGKSIVFVEQRLADLRDPLVGVLVELSVHRLARPEGDVVQIDDVIICAAIDEGAQFTIADGQRLLKEVGRTVILQHHRSLLHLCLTKCQTPCENRCQKKIFSHHRRF